MKILIVSNLYPPNVFGGYERLCFDVAAALQDRGHDITVLTSSYGKDDDSGIGHEVIRRLFLFATEGNIYEEFRDSPENIRAHEANNIKVFNETVREVDPDIIFVWNLYFFNSGLLREIDSSEYPKTYLLTDNWMIAQLNPGFIGKYFSENVLLNPQAKFRFLRKLARVLKKAIGGPGGQRFDMNGRAIFPSRFMNSLYSDSGFKFKGGESICYHGVRFLHSDNARRVSRDRMLEEGTVRLLFAGRVVNIKGVHTAVESLATLRKLDSGLNTRLTIVGGTEDQGYYKNIVAIAKSLGATDLVEFRSSVAEDQLFDLFQQHDIYLFPSLYEPFSLTLILALESGIPTVASDVGGNVEIVHNNETGLVFKAGDSVDLAKKIYNLIKNGALRDRLSRAAIGHASTFTFESMVSRIETDLKGGAQ